VVPQVVPQVVELRAAQPAPEQSGDKPAAAHAAGPAGTLMAPPPLTPLTATVTLGGERHLNDGTFLVLAQVLNTADRAMGKPQVTVVLRDSDDEELAQYAGYGLLSTLDPGQSTPVKILVKTPPVYDHYTVEVAPQRLFATSPPAQELRIETLPAIEDVPMRGFSIGGTVFNDGDQAARFVQVIALAHDSAGALLGIDSVYVVGDDGIAPGGSGRFTMSYLQYDTRPATWDFLVTGRAAH